MRRLIFLLLFIPAFVFGQGDLSGQMMGGMSGGLSGDVVIKGVIPTDIANLGLWLDSEVGVTLVGSDVSVWADQSGRGDNVTAEEGTRPALTLNSINGHPTVDSDGASEFMSLSIGLTLTDFTAFIVGNDRANEFVFGVHSNTSYYIETRTAANVFRASGTETFAHAVPAVSAYANTILRSAGSVTSYRNTVASINNPQANASNYFITRLFVRGTTIYGLCSVAEIIVYERALTSEEIANVELYLNRKYSIY